MSMLTISILSLAVEFLTLLIVYKNYVDGLASSKNKWFYIN